MNRFVFALVLGYSILGFAADATDGPIFFGTGLCGKPQFECMKITSNQSWEKLFPDEKQRDIVQRVNRNYNYLYAGKVIAVPKNLKDADLLDFSPFPDALLQFDGPPGVLD